MNPENPGEGDYRIRDIHGDKDSAIIDRIKKQKEWQDLQKKVIDALWEIEVAEIIGMTVNERLYVSGLINEFDKYKTSNKRFAQFILESLKVDQASIERILK